MLGFRALAGVLALVATGCAPRVLVAPTTRPGEPRPEPPPGLIGVNIVSRDVRVWDVRGPDGLQCRTPCTRWLRPSDSLLLKSRADEVFLPNLAGGVGDARHALVVAQGTSVGKKVNGIVFTTLGGMALVTAITFTAVGCSNVQRRGGLCTAGLITGGVGLPLTAGSIWMIVDSAPKARVIPVRPEE